MGIGSRGWLSRHGGGLIVLLLSASAVAAPSDGALRPDAAPAIQRLFDRMKPAVAWDDIKIARDSVVARLCPSGLPKDACFAVRLEAPGVSCKGRVVGTFCLVLPDGPPPAAQLAVVEAALTGEAGQSVWSPPELDASPKQDPPPPPTRWFAESIGQAIHSRRTLVLAVLVVPMLAGALLGWILRLVARRRVTGKAALLALLAIPMVAGALLSSAWPRLGRLDGVTEGLLLGLGVAWAAHRVFADRRAIVMLTVSLAASLMALEVGSRLLLPPVPGFSVEETDFRINPALHVEQPVMAGGQDHACYVAYPDQYQRRTTSIRGPTVPLRATTAAPPEHPRRRVLHLGDSMTYGFGVGPDETFEAELGRLEPDVAHTNAAIIGIGPDDYLVVLRKWLAQAPVDLAVMYLFEGNDLSEIDKGHPCSNWQPILDLDAKGAPLRFPDGPHEAHAMWERLHVTSPPPFLVRALARRSKVAEQLAIALSRLRTPDVNAIEPDEVRWVHLDAILRAARDEVRAKGGELVIVVLPLKKYVQERQPGEIEQRMVAVAKGAGVPLFDAGDLIRDAFGRGEPVFLSETDMHLGVNGNRLVARWLHEKLPPAPTAAVP